MSLDTRELAQKLRGQLMQCAGWEGSNEAADRTRALNYYYQRPRGDEERGRSNVVAGDVSSMVEATLAQMTEAFSHDTVAHFEAEGPQDDDQALLESHAVTAAVMRDNNGHQLLTSAIKDALLLRNGWTKIYVEERDVTETQTLEGDIPAVVAEMRSQPDVSVKLVSYDRDADTAQVRLTKTVKRFRVESPDPGNMLYPSDWHTTDCAEIPFIAERHVETRGRLLERGFPKAKVMKLKGWRLDTKSDILARDIRGQTRIPAPIDKSQDLIEWYEIYALVDSGDGSQERRRFALAGTNWNSILEDEPWPLQPYATGTPFVNAHRLTGISLYDKLHMRQDVNTHLERALLDNVNTVIKNRVAYLDGKVNTDDLADGRPNGEIRVRASVGNVQNAITAFQQPDISAGILANLEHQKGLRTELGGASLELASGSMQMAGGRIGSQGVDRAFSVMEQLAAHMTKNIATSLIRNTYLIAHATLRAYFDTPFNVKVNGKWEQPTPSEWPVRSRVTVNIGMSPGERARRVAAYQATIDAQLALAERGMDEVLVNINGFHRALTDWGRSMELPNPEQYWLDPRTPESQQALKQKTEAEQRDAAAQRALMGEAVGLERLRSGLDKYKHDSELQFKYFAEVLGAEVDEAKIVGAATAAMLTAKSGEQSADEKRLQQSDSGAESSADNG